MERGISSRGFLKESAIALSTVAIHDSASIGSSIAGGRNKSQVFFTKNITVNGLLKIYSNIKQGMTGRIGIKLHTAEPNGSNILPRDMVKALQKHIPNSNLVEKYPV